MRYDNWDIILFPRDCKTPLKEFDVCCQVLPDSEFSHTQGSFGLPTLSCFIPSLEFGTPFKISIHSWDRPPISQFTRSYSKFSDNVIFEARLFMDGRLVASTSFGRHQDNWPHVISNIFNFSKNGDLEALTFPKFHVDFLQKSRRSPVDNMGRIKLVLSEGFPRDSPSTPIERVKNIVAFSFQHAPLDILENVGVAWPNPSMWQRSPFNSSMPVPADASENWDLHTHSPRRKKSSHTDQLTCNLPLMQGVMSENCPSNFGNAVDFNNRNRAFNLVHGAPQYVNNEYSFEWPNQGESAMAVPKSHSVSDQFSRVLRKSNTDTSMTDYIPSNGSDGQFSWTSDQARHLLSGFPEVEVFTGHNKPTANTLATGRVIRHCTNEPMLEMATQARTIPPGLATSLTHSLLNQPIPPSHTKAKPESVPSSSIKSRKEALLQKQADSSPVSSKSATDRHRVDISNIPQQIHLPAGVRIPEETVSAKFIKEKQNFHTRNPSGADQLSIPGNEARANIPSVELPTTLRDISGNSEKGAKRVRQYSPTSVKVIDNDDEPRRSSVHFKLPPFLEGEGGSRAVT